MANVVPAEADQLVICSSLFHRIAGSRNKITDSPNHKHEVPIPGYVKPEAPVHKLSSYLHPVQLQLVGRSNPYVHRTDDLIKARLLKTVNLLEETVCCSVWAGFLESIQQAHVGDATFDKLRMGRAKRAADSFLKQVDRLEQAGYPQHTLVSVAEKILKKSRNCHTSEGSPQDNVKLAVIPYIHRVSHNLKKIAEQVDVKVVFSAPLKLSRLCKLTNPFLRKAPACNVNHQNKYVICQKGVVYEFPCSCGRCTSGSLLCVSNPSTTVALIAVATCKARMLSFCNRHRILPEDVRLLFGGFSPSMGHGKRICSILKSEWSRQARLYRIHLEGQLHSSLGAEQAQRAFRHFSHLANQTTESLWQCTLSQLRAHHRPKVKTVQVNRIYTEGNVTLPEDICKGLALGPKFAVQPRTSGPELLSLVHKVSGLAPASEMDRCMPRYSKKEEINFNERLTWRRPTQVKEDYREALVKGLPFPILTIAEYFSQDMDGFCWGRRYRLAGHYAFIMLWESMCP
ncbi:hypothetical protein HPB51_020544 [Rhipicephalus microplus]|uniref:Tick transposon n=1 Tax=Rhipicephalus microplus TaxID=6941 RepID=A0A9J6D6Z6_RHIMP|nr:hypothetical protein HPB51_020544 [Rhipicephalus microplus]